MKNEEAKDEETNKNDSEEETNGIIPICSTTFSESENPSIFSKAHGLNYIMDFIETKAIVNTDISTLKIKVKVAKYLFLPNRTLIQPSGFFTSGDIKYVIETSPTGWSVERTFEELNWLRNRLSKIYPSMIALLFKTLDTITKQERIED